MFICQECKAVLVKPSDYHPFVYCQIAKAYPQAWREIVKQIDKKAHEEERKKLFKLGFTNKCLNCEKEAEINAFCRKCDLEIVHEKLKSGGREGDSLEAGVCRQPSEAGSNPAPAKRLKGWCAFNRGDPEIDNMSFERTKKEIMRCWGKSGQEIQQCELLIFGEGDNKK